MDLFPRPSHADYTYQMKYGVRASSGGGRSSARETIGRVASGAIAEKMLKEAYGVEIVSFVYSVGDEELFPPTPMHPSAASNPTYLKMLETITREEVDRYVPVRCPNQEAADRMAKKIADFRDKQDSIGGTVVCVIRNAPVGLGEPCFDKLEATLAQAMLSLPATKGFEFGSGFAGCTIPGSKHNDAFVKAPAVPPSKSGADAVTNGSHANGSTGELNGVPSGQFPVLKTRTNNSGGIQGGISNGAPIYFRVAVSDTPTLFQGSPTFFRNIIDRIAQFKPPATIGQAQETSTFSGTAGTLEAKGRHDPCVVPRAVPIVEAMAAITLLDACMAQEARNVLRNKVPSGVPREQEEDETAAY
ncbi:bifunctional chorismate synthase/riboflavin reductase [NAD(P)H] aro2 [Bacidia gigantensis]|uniref:bifunctional chorismate synthase/riboflavin reductase [NAD(P)H] aro2 n=1 Tax=Bacidia gigantensis TaxID=2732470 RepID=UPI001D0559B3|nr:bifunctional chorismate synthase/riboflavin reductase [NAD(P)H] aro2 [Bacidia gigantensis]KAG8527899.1 bifunctional chorismate synthase/riboflavin reductase [NAD(P)H] aro2 [Bacidia gigantensis]